MHEPGIIRLIMFKWKLRVAVGLLRVALKLQKVTCSPTWYEIVTTFGMIRVFIYKQHFIYNVVHS